MNWLLKSKNYVEQRLAAKMVLTVALVVVLVIGVSFAMIYTTRQTTGEQNTRQVVQSMAVAHGTIVGLWLDSRKAEMSGIANSPTAISGSMETLKRFGGYESIWIADAQGDFRSTTGNGGNMADRDFFLPARRGEPVVSSPVQSKTTGKWTVVVASPIYRDGKFEGVVAGTVELSELSSRIGAIPARKGSNVFIAQKDGQTVGVKLQSDAEAPTQMKQALDAMPRGDSGVMRFDFDGAEKYVGFAVVPGTDWGVAVTEPTAAVDSQLSDMRRLMLGSLLVGVLLVSLVIFLLVRRFVSSPLQQVRQQLRQIGQGQFVAPIDVTSQDEIGATIIRFNLFAETLQAMIAEISRETAAVQTANGNLLNVAATMASNSEEVSSQIIETSGTVEDISSQIRLVAESSRDTSKNISAVVDAIGSISKAINEVVGSSGNMTDSVKSALVSAEETDVAMQAIAAAVTEINSSLYYINEKCDRSAEIAQNTEKEARESVKAIKILNDQSRNIGQIVKLINSIAEKTDMLALNAAIEAVRAGQAGKGFAVVANEVKELAHQTASATREIGAQITIMQERITDAVETVTGVMTVIQETTAITGTIRESVGAQVGMMGNIYNAAESAAREANGVRTAMDSLSNHADNIAQSINLLAVAADEVNNNAVEAADRVEEVARSADEVSVSVEHVAQTTLEIMAASRESAQLACETTEAATLLMEVSEQLNTIVEKFRAD